MTIYLSNRDGNGKTSEEGHYKFQTSIWAGSILGTNSLKVSQNTTLGMSVLISPGQFKIDTSSEYAYTGWNSSTLLVNIPTSDPANPRISTVVMYVDRNESTSPVPPNNPGIVKVTVVDGTPSATPISPNDTIIQASIGAGNPYIKLADIRVNAGASQISNSNITDLRQQVTLGTNLISTDSIIDQAITTSKLKDLAVTTDKIANFNVTANKIAAGAAIKPSEIVVFQANKTSNQTTVTDNSLQTVTFQTKNEFKGTNTISGSTFTAPAKGWLFTVCTLTIDGGTDADDTMNWGFYKNSTTIVARIADNWRKFSTASGVEYPTTLNGAFPLEAGDTVQVRYTGTSVALTILGSANDNGIWTGMFIRDN